MSNQEPIGYAFASDVDMMRKKILIGDQFTVRRSGEVPLYTSPQGGWVKCKDSLPPPNTRVMGYAPRTGIIYDMWYMPEEYPETTWMTVYSLWDGRLTHWAYLPKPPEMEEDW